MYHSIKLTAMGFKVLNSTTTKNLTGTLLFGCGQTNSPQQVMIFDFDTQYFYQNSISSKNGDKSLMHTFHFEPIIKPISLIEGMVQAWVGQKLLKLTF